MSNLKESGLSTYVGNFHLLINVCTGFGQSYNPQNPALHVEAMNTQLVGVQESINHVDTLLPAYLTATATRQERFVLVMPLATRVQATAIVLGLPSTIITRIKEVVRKIRGERAHKLTDKNTTGSDGEPVKHSSVSQTSFNEKIEHFNQLIDLVSSQPAYNPIETELTVPALTALLTEMRDSNTAVVHAAVPLASARQTRDELLYAPKTGMIDTALLVKEYVKAVFGASSHQYKEVRHIKFRNK